MGTLDGEFEYVLRTGRFMPGGTTPLPVASWKHESDPALPWLSFVHLVSAEELECAASSKTPPRLPAPIWDAIANGSPRPAAVVGLRGRMSHHSAHPHTIMFDAMACRATGTGPTSWLYPPHATAQDAWRARFKALRVHPSEITSADLAELVPGAASIDQSSDSRLSIAAQVLAEFQTVRAVATDLARDAHPSALFVGIDVLERFPGVTRPGGAARHDPFGPACRARQWDMIVRFVEVLMRELGRETKLLLIADGGDRFNAAAIPAWSPDGSRTPESMGLAVLRAVLPRSESGRPAPVPLEPWTEEMLAEHERDLEAARWMAER
ncbi:MAG: hypothetical protein AAGI30_07145 [Planctomycetota bacterium]